MQHRSLLFHKQSTSARLRFLRLAHGSVLACEPLTGLDTAQVVDAPSQTTVLHGTVVLQGLQQCLGIPAQDLRVEREFRCAVATTEATLPIFLVAIETLDPPFGGAAEVGATFIDLTQARGLPDVELDLLRRAYEQVLGG